MNENRMKPPFTDFNRRVDARWIIDTIAQAIVNADENDLLPWVKIVGSPNSRSDIWREWEALGELEQQVALGFGLLCGAEAIALSVLWSQPRAALAWTVNEWRHDVYGEGVSETLMRTARNVLDAHNAPAADEDVAALAVACRTHARAFLASIEAGLPSYATADGFAAFIKGSNGGPGDLSPAGLRAWCGDFYGPHPAAGLEDGAPWLSARLADYLRGELGAPDEADAWLEKERERSAVLQPDLPGMPPRPVLPGWLGFGHPDIYLHTGHYLHGGCSLAWFNLAAVVWVARERAKEQRYPTSSMLFPLTGAGAVNPTDRGGAWVVTAVDPVVMARLERSGALNTVESQALFRFLPDLARQAANVPGREVVAWSDGAAAVTVCMGGDHRTAVNVRGGWSAFAAALGFAGGSAQAVLANAARGFAALPVRWSADVANGTTSIILDLEERTADGRVSFALPRLLWPGFSTELKNADREREGRRRVPVPPTLPPTTNPKLGAGPSRLELAAHAWIRDHLDSIVDELGAPVPWGDLADRVPLSTAKQRSRRDATLARLLALWRAEGRWVRTDQDADRALWRPAYGWTGPGSLIEALDQVREGRSIQALSKHRRKTSRKR